jgi:two-component system, cell cycle sensor histidine kinase and response regulator CckA
MNLTALAKDACSNRGASPGEEVGAQSQPIGVKSGVQLAALLRRIDKHRDLRDQFRQLQRMESLALLASGVAHDFNNILTGVLGFGELILSDMDEADPHRNRIERMVDSAIRGRALTGQLLAFTRDEALPIYALSLDAEIDQMQDVLKRLIGEHIEVRISLACGVEKILTERGAVFQVILNLAVNARDAMPQGGLLTIRTFPDEVQTNEEKYTEIPKGRYVVLEISDTGCGMDAMLKERIFQPFFTTKMAGRGTGLGLYTVSEIVNRCRGHIRVESEIDRGSTFRMFFPVVKSSSRTKQVACAKSRKKRTRNELIVVVEDNDAVREVLLSQLTKQGYRVACHASPSAALRASERLGEDFKLLLTDVVMPEMNGPELASQLRHRRPGLKVVYITGWAPAEILPADALGEDSALLRKPFTVRELNSSLRHLLD